jgi:hypothetical protein
MTAEYENSVVKTSCDKLNVHKIRKYKSSFKKNIKITITAFRFKFSNIIQFKITRATLAAMEQSTSPDKGHFCVTALIVQEETPLLL